MKRQNKKLIWKKFYVPESVTTAVKVRVRPMRPDIRSTAHLTFPVPSNYISHRQVPRLNYISSFYKCLLLFCFCEQI